MADDRQDMHDLRDIEGGTVSNTGMISAAVGYVLGLADSWELKACLGGLGALYAAVSGGDAVLLGAVYVLMMLDILLGLCEAVLLGKFSPYRLHRGVLKFLSYTVTILLIAAVSAAVNTSIGMNIHIQDFFMSYLIATEVISVVRHAVRLGWPVPPLLIKLAFAAKERTEQAAELLIDSKILPSDGAQSGEQGAHRHEGQAENQAKQEERTEHHGENHHEHGSGVHFHTAHDDGHGHHAHDPHPHGTHSHHSNRRGRV